MARAIHRGNRNPHLCVTQQLKIADKLPYANVKCVSHTSKQMFPNLVINFSSSFIVQTSSSIPAHAPIVSSSWKYKKRRMLRGSYKPSISCAPAGFLLAPLQPRQYHIYRGGRYKEEDRRSQSALIDGRGPFRAVRRNQFLLHFCGSFFIIII